MICSEQCSVQNVLTKPDFSNAQGGMSARVCVCSAEEQQFTHLWAREQTFIEGLTGCCAHSLSLTSTLAHFLHLCLLQIP